MTPVSIGGKTDPSDIANTFRDFYSSVYVNSHDNLDAVNEFTSCYNSHCNNDTKSEPMFINADSCRFDTDCIERCIKSLKLNKAAGLDEVLAENIVHAHPAIVVHLKLLFSMMLAHSFVPDAFGSGVIVPIVKDKNGDVSSVDNYRPITLSSVISKLFESAILDKFSKFWQTDALQFGFKKGLSCSHAIYALRQVVDYFANRDSNTYIASLDASKAFDRVNHLKLFTILIKKGLPRFLVETIINWYEKLSVVVRWNGQVSSSLSVSSGVRQGGILSPSLFNLYVNCFITQLRNSDLGCHVKNIYLGCLMYADDLLLISSSVIDLQRMLNICGMIGDGLEIKFNGSKSKCIVIGPKKVHNLASFIIIIIIIIVLRPFSPQKCGLDDTNKFMLDLILAKDITNPSGSKAL